MANKILSILFFGIILFLFSCEKKKQNSQIEEVPQTLIKELYDKIDLFIDSSNCKTKKIISIRYQRYDKREFIQIASDEIFITDSLYTLKEYRNYLLAYYNADFFDTIIVHTNDDIIEKNQQWNLDSVNYYSTGLPCYTIYEKLKDKDLKPILSDTYLYNNLFSAPPMFSPPPPPVNEK